ncbi:PadR family transcriptional regulator [Paludisphaera mucosa]|uniref:PadR family transcriptional regulator n=1 Tax=Paludisphaera mucosa TaxID=3030827 RepID=A0ABT6F9L4_9BACT|nr:PadR family transcriptional regulator [Paludisphaera mucosa]MDG3004202.1 PadR family transcriptional regulator [Paludisphaera mucosa]
MSPWETQLRKGLVELAVLATMVGGEAYGYGIVERLRKIEGLEFTESTVYPVLARLAREGFLAIRAEPSPAGPMRRYYRLTSEGERRFREMTRSWRTVSASLSNLLEGVQG